MPRTIERKMEFSLMDTLNLASCTGKSNLYKISAPVCQRAWERCHRSLVHLHFPSRIIAPSKHLTVKLASTWHAHQSIQIYVSLEVPPSLLSSPFQLSYIPAASKHPTRATISILNNIFNTSNTMSDRTGKPVVGWSEHEIVSQHSLHTICVITDPS